MLKKTFGWLFCVVSLLGCSANELRWSEEVILPDGRVVTLKRVQQFDQGGYVGAHSFEFENPASRKAVRWESDGFFSLVALVLIKEVPYVLVSPKFGVHNEHAGCPYPSMFVYRYNGLLWEQVPYSKSPLREIKNNVTMDPKMNRKYIQERNNKILRGGVRTLSHPTDQHYFGINLDKFPVQVFQCPKQKRIDFQ